MSSVRRSAFSPAKLVERANGDITGLILLTLDALPGSCTPAE